MTMYEIGDWVRISNEQGTEFSEGSVVKYEDEDEDEDVEEWRG